MAVEAVDVEVDVVAEVEEVLGVAAEGVEEECPYLQVEGAPEQTIFHMHAPCRYGHVLMAATSSGRLRCEKRQLASNHARILSSILCGGSGPCDL